MDKTNLSAYVNPTDKALFKQFVKDDPGKTVGDVFHDMVQLYKEHKVILGN